MNLLHIDSSILGSNSVSRSISAAIVSRLKGELPALEVHHHDLASAPLPHLSGAYLAGQSADVKHDQALQEDLALGGRVLDEFLAADVVVIGVPMYNFGIPSQLKAWIDRILVAGKTFRYNASGAEGLVHGKRVILAVSRGGFYAAGTPAAVAEHQESHLRALFGFIGVKDLEVVRAEGIAHGPEQRETSLKAALGEAGALRAA
jgi:FMN-dependent NADH-azoreductase